MGTVVNQAIGAILKNYADVIEGGNSYRGAGTAYLGIPGTYPNDEGLRSGDDTPLAVVGSTVSTTTFDVAGTYSWPSTRWVKEQAPPFWALCNTAGSNFEQARKISGWNNTTKVFTCAAFDATPSASDSMIMMQGFKRIGDYDIEAEHERFTGGFDRFFHLFMGHGDYQPYSGRGVKTYQSIMSLRLRMLKHGRTHDTVAAAFENLATLTAALELGADPDHRDGTYVQSIWSEDGEAEETVNDEHKVVLLQKFIVRYRISAELK